jgi:hypothetical protein
VELSCCYVYIVGGFFINFFFFHSIYFFQSKLMFELFIFPLPPHIYKLFVIIFRSYHKLPHGNVYEMQTCCAFTTSAKLFFKPPHDDETGCKGVDVPLLAEEMDNVVEAVFSVSTSLSMEHELVKLQSTLSQVLLALAAVCSISICGFDVLLFLLFSLAAITG